jgi:hypothetical protein
MQNRNFAFTRNLYAVACAILIMITLCLGLSWPRTSNSLDTRKATLAFWMAFTGYLSLSFALYGLVLIWFRAAFRRSRMFWLLLIVLFFLAVGSILGGTSFQ